MSGINSHFSLYLCCHGRDATTKLEKTHTHTQATVRLTREISFFKNHSQRRKYFIQVCYALFSLSFEIMLLLLLPMPLILVHSFSMIHVQLLLFARSIFLGSTIFSIFKVQNFESPICCQNSFYLNTLSYSIFGWRWPLSFAKAHKFHTDKNKWKSKEKYVYIENITSVRSSVRWSILKCSDLFTVVVHRHKFTNAQNLRNIFLGIQRTM